jgi:hypothetical protein
LIALSKNIKATTKETWKHQRILRERNEREEQGVHPDLAIRTSSSGRKKNLLIHNTKQQIALIIHQTKAKRQTHHQTIKLFAICDSLFLILKFICRWMVNGYQSAIKCWGVKVRCEMVGRRNKKESVVIY